MRDMLMPFFSASRRHGAGDRGFQRQIAVVAGVEPDRQAEVRNADMLDLRSWRP